MARRLLGVVGVVCALLPAAAAHGAATLGLAEVRDSNGTLLGEAGNGSFAYPADGSVLRIGSARADAARVVLRDVTMFNGRVTGSSFPRAVSPARASTDWSRTEGRTSSGLTR